MSSSCDPKRVSLVWSHQLTLQEDQLGRGPTCKVPTSPSLAVQFFGCFGSVHFQQAAKKRINRPFFARAFFSFSSSRINEMFMLGREAEPERSVGLEFRVSRLDLGRCEVK